DLHERVAAHVDHEVFAVHHLDQAYRARATLGEPVAEAGAELANRAAALGRARFDIGDLAGADEAFALVDSERARVGRIGVRLHTDPDCDLEAAGAEIDALLLALRDDDAIIEALLARAYVSLTRGRIAELSETLENALVVAQRAGRSRAEAETLF